MEILKLFFIKRSLSIFKICAKAHLKLYIKSLNWGDWGNTLLHYNYIESGRSDWGFRGVREVKLKVRDFNVQKDYF